MVKFRAWDKQEREFVPYLHDIVLKHGETIEGIEYEMPHEGIVYNDISYFELLQSTGLKDKNGVEIFEGDVVKTKYGEHGRHIGVVKYGGAKFYSNGVKQYLSWHEDLNGLFEIIGNRYEHPHLLEGDTE